MISVKNENAIAEVIHYLKGIRQEDIDKIPKKFITYLQENASKEYICNFDYNKPLKELELLDETRGIIGMICYNYWCETKEQKEQYLKQLSKNEKIYEEVLREKYNPDDLFKNKNAPNENYQKNNIAMVQYKDSLFKRILNKIEKFLKKK